MKNKDIFPFFLAISIVFSACSAEDSVSSEPAENQVLETNSQKSITICLGEEPDSLYLYSANSQAAELIFQAIYDGPINIESGKPLPVILESIPNFNGGSAFLTSVEVSEGEEVINSEGELVQLQAGMQVFPTGCTDSQCAIEWDGVSPLQMDFITAAYKLKPALTWSDGQPLVASDSVFSFNVASDPETPGDKGLNKVIASYSAVDDLTVLWTSKPGLMIDAFENYFWTPLPEHAWGKYSASELLSADEVNRMPVGWGAYRVEEWVTGKNLRLSKNPNYFRVGEDLPYFDELIFKFINPYGDTALSNLKFDRAPFQQFNYDLGDFEKEISINGCDMSTTTSDLRDQLPVLNILLNYFKDPAIKVLKTSTYEDQMIIFNLRQNTAVATKPLLDLNVRKAVNLCLNRSKMINDLSFGQYSLVNANNGLDSQKNGSDPYDPAAGKALLDQSGWKDADDNSETPRISSGLTDVSDGKELGFRYFVEDIKDNLKSAEIVKASLTECGIGINIKAVPPEIFWDAMSTDSIFQANYDLVQLSWSAPITNPCPLFSPNSIPTTENKYSGINFSGFANDGFDQACSQLELTHLKYDRDILLEKISAIIGDAMPVIPLYRYSELMIAQKNFCDEKLGKNLNNELTKIEEFNISPDCQ